MDYTQTNVLSMTGGTDFATIADLTNYVDLTTNQTITSGIKTFTTLPQSSAVPSTGNQLVNKTYVDGAFVTIGTAQTVTGAKTFNANVRLPTTVSLILGSTSTGGKILHTAPHNYYDNQSGNHYFFIAGLPNMYIDNDGVNIENGKFLYFNGKRMSITDNGTSLVTDVPTGNSHSFRINNVDKLTLHPTFGATFTDNVNIQSDKYLNFSGGSYLLEEPSFTNLIYNVPTSFKHQFRVNGFDAVAISSDVNGTLFTFPSGTIMREYTSFDWFLYQMPAAHTLKYQVAGNDIMEVASGGMIVYEAISLRDGKKLIWDEGFTNIAYLRKDTTTSTLDYEVATGYKHKFMVNGTSVLNIGDSAFGLRSDNNVFILNNNWLYLDAFNDGIRIDPSGNMIMQSLMGTGNFQFFTGASIIGTMTLSSMSYTNNNYAIKLGLTNAVTIQQDATGTAFQYIVPTSWFHTFQIGSANYMRLSNTALGLLQNNLTINFGNTNICSIKQDTGTSAFRMDAPSGYTIRMRINSTTYGQITTSGLQVTGGYFTRTGASGSFGTSVFNNSWTFPNLTCWIDTTNIGNYSISDIRIKKNVVEARPILDRLCKLSMIEYNYIENGLFKDDGILHYGYIAQEIKAEFPEFPNLTIGEDTDMTEDGYVQPIRVNAEFSNLFMGAVIELNKKVETQQAQIVAQQTQMEAMQKQIDGLVLALSKIMSQ